MIRLLRERLLVEVVHSIGSRSGSMKPAAPVRLSVSAITGAKPL